MATRYIIPPETWRRERRDWLLFTNTQAIASDIFEVVSRTSTYKVLRNTRIGLTYETKYYDRLQPISTIIYRRTI